MPKLNGSTVPIWTVILLLVGFNIGIFTYLLGRIATLEAITTANTVQISVNTERILNMRADIMEIKIAAMKLLDLHQK
jgi:hypothetical protein